ncbi:MAG TPA: hypothetical protein ENG63_08270 [Candidatus Desulfofervidus auxilii]|uniref:Uncharacterized protein n=1 Tax=Desulfofervidus auxilii TaxID=1621989 RepID=A0A7C0U3Q1_DESA2|nr:hypothetical protein [Candidatus Desulfofervidus auxilii]
MDRRENDDDKAYIEKIKSLSVKSFEPYYHIGLGKWVRSASHYKKLLHEAGAVEVGTEDIRSPEHKGLSREDIREMYRNKTKKRKEI